MHMYVVLSMGIQSTCLLARTINAHYLLKFVRWQHFKMIAVVEKGSKRRIEAQKKKRKIPRRDERRQTIMKKMMMINHIKLPTMKRKPSRARRHVGSRMNNLTPLEYRCIHLNTQATSVLLSALSGDKYNKRTWWGKITDKKFVKILEMRLLKEESLILLYFADSYIVMFYTLYSFLFVTGRTNIRERRY
ncbi:hypothetical protein ACJX0J_026004 [Zea mays]